MEFLFINIEPCFILTLLKKKNNKKHINEMAFCFFSTVALSYTFLKIHFSVCEKGKCKLL